MSAREVKVHPLNVRPGDVVVSVKSDVEITVRREVADVPTKPCSIGYATAHGASDIFVVRTDEAGPGRLAWFLPVPTAMEGTTVRWLHDEEISDFRPLVARPEVTQAQVLVTLDRHREAFGPDSEANYGCTCVTGELVEGYRVHLTGVLMALLGGAS
jgi:hypothetical protein